MQYQKRLALGLCSRCGKREPIEGKTVCFACLDYLKKYRLQRERKIRKTLINLFGGKCRCCGYHRNYAALEFHHLDVNEKENFNRIYQYWRLYKEQGIKGLQNYLQLFCSNCHREIHNPNLFIGDYR